MKIYILFSWYFIWKPKIYFFGKYNFSRRSGIFKCN